MLYAGYEISALTPIAAPVSIAVSHEDIARPGTRSASGTLLLHPRRTVRHLTLTWRPVGMETIDGILQRLAAGSVTLKYVDPATNAAKEGRFVCLSHTITLLQPGKYEMKMNLTEL